MAHSAIHFSIGMITGSAITFPAIITAWRMHLPLAKKIRRWLLTSYLIGIYAVIPSLLGWIGFSEKFCRGWWMNIFLFHPIINKIATTGRLFPAIIAVFLSFIIPYCLLIAAIINLKRAK